MRSGESEDKKEEILAKTPINSTSRMQTSKNINESARRDPAKEFFAMVKLIYKSIKTKPSV